MLSSKFSMLFRVGTLCGVFAMLVLVTGCPPTVPCEGDAECDDGLFCTGVETCDPDAAICVDGTAPCVEGEVCDEEMDRCEECGNEGQADCDDADLCTTDACVDGVCVFTAVNCDDADACTTDSCDAATGDCVNAAIDCDDGDPCTDDSCDPATGCVNTAIDCDDGDACTDDSCVDGACVNAAIDCDDADLCTDDSCDPATGCVNTLIEACVDGDLCTQDLCDAGVCDNPPVDCPDGTSCDPDTGDCVDIACETDADCDDDDLCTDDECTVDGCVNTPVECAQGQACDPDTGNCEDIECTENADCDDGFSCTLDECNLSTNVCEYTNRDNACIDALFCNGVEFCDPADPDAEEGTGCVIPGDPCPPQICNEAEDACENCTLNSQCDDGFSCTLDTCVAGACNNAPQDAECDDGLYCTVDDFCDPADDNADADGCVNEGTPCECGVVDCGLGVVDGYLLCDEVNDECLGCAGEAGCNDGITCTVDVCEAAVGAAPRRCTNTAGTCPDPFFCDGVDLCEPDNPDADANGCVPPPAPACDNPEPICNEIDDVCEICLANADCEEWVGVDADACTKTVCQGATGTCDNVAITCVDVGDCPSGCNTDCVGGFCVN